MQIKKATRDGSYSEPARYESQPYALDQSDGYGDSPATEGFAARPGRPASANGASEGDNRAQAPVATESIIDRNSSFDGRFETEQDLRVQGSISGEITCRGIFTVEKEASARARIQARDAHIHGRLEGDIICSGKLVLSATAHVTGTLKAGTLVVEEGATLSGTVETSQATGTVTRTIGQEPATVTREPAAAAAPRQARRDLPSFAIVASDDRATADRN